MLQDARCRKHVAADILAHEVQSVSFGVYGAGTRSTRRREWMERARSAPTAYRMIQPHAAHLEVKLRIGCQTFRTTGGRAHRFRLASRMFGSNATPIGPARPG
jgi:hypothetical protein